MRYSALLLILTVLVLGAWDVDLQKITPWLLGANFTIAIFSVNFIFFGYQLSKYKEIYSDITKRQWFNVVALLCLPFVPLICFLIAPAYYEKIALWALPVLLFSSVDNALLTRKYLSPKRFLEEITTDKAIAHYLDLLARKLDLEVGRHRVQLVDQKKYQLPMHARDFEPSALGLDDNDVWDAVAVTTNLAMKNNDYPVFRQSLHSILKLVFGFYSFKRSGGDSYEVEAGIRFVARNRMRAIISGVAEDDVGGVFLQSLSSELCSFLMRDELLGSPCSNIARAIASDAVWVGEKMIESHSVVEPIKILNTIHRVVESSVYIMEGDGSSNDSKVLDRYNISAYVYDIKVLGECALTNGNFHFAYRCMESLSYLGCNAAKFKAAQVVIAVFESIVHLGRLSRHLKIGCFWSRCLIPAESHAEEFMGHIMTWMVHDLDAGGVFFMKDYAEQSFSRLRGVKCIIKPRLDRSTCFWIVELERDGMKVPHVEYESGMYGYGGKSDYSDFSNMKEYVLHGIGSQRSSVIVHGAPMPLNLDNGDDENI